MTDCAKCPYYGYDPVTGWMCSVRICIDNPNHDYLMEQEEIWDEHDAIQRDIDEEFRIDEARARDYASI